MSEQAVLDKLERWRLKATKFRDEQVPTSGVEFTPGDRNTLTPSESEPGH